MRFSITGGLVALLFAFAANSGINVAPAAAAHAEKHGKLHARLSERHPGMLLMSWKGPTDESMAPQIAEAYNQYKGEISAIYLILNSPGGSVRYGERAIAVLQEIKKSVKLYTGVKAGAKCASMCVFIYVQGDKRFAAPASLWLFHEVSRSDSHKHLVSLNRDGWLKMVDRYWVPAGVDLNWIARVKAEAMSTNVWESGAQLLQENANLVQKPLSDNKLRVINATPDD
ncbi:MAG: ATP-dependent Clp protease proteolytic subunit [Proteobacteria bacterium]|nr:ATP-dependent Clp protease proteolytic subunit [Pseudomonadota bacterium]